MTKSIALSGAMILAICTTAMAGTPRVNYREHRQQVRISQGIYSGELSPSEAARLEAQQMEIRRMEARARANGSVSPWERARLNYELNRTNRTIHHQKHD